MRSSGNLRAAVSGMALLVVLAPCVAAAQSANDRYTQALGREQVLRKDLDALNGGTSTPLLRRIRTLVVQYQEIVRRFPRSGYSDNALYQAALLSADAFWHFGEERDRQAALRLFAAVRKEYPASSLIKQLTAHEGRLAAARRAAALPAPAPAKPQQGSVLKAIRRNVVPDALRITLELEREAAFRDERLEGPPRVFIDLQNTVAADRLQDATIPFPDDVVRQVRIGRQEGATRVVLDLQDAARHSVYALYDPYRIVIDFERPAPPAESAAPPAAATANSQGGFSLSRQLGLGVSRVVIDAGHGGHDPGAHVKGLNEADLTLDVALRLEKLLLNVPGVEVVMTRRTNVYIPLEERTAIANRSGADLFLSIHANASRNPQARGIETYFLNFAPNPEAEAIAARENAGSSRTMHHLPDIVKAIALNNKLDESRDFATLIQSSMHEQLRKVNREAKDLGVKQAPFMVLIGATMPSVLAEISFLTNRQEAGLLRTAAYRQAIAEALFHGISKYQKSLKAAETVASPGLR